MSRPLVMHVTQNSEYVTLETWLIKFFWVILCRLVSGDTTLVYKWNKNYYIKILKLNFYFFWKTKENPNKYNNFNFKLKIKKQKVFKKIFETSIKHKMYFESLVWLLSIVQQIPTFSLCSSWWRTSFCIRNVIMLLIYIVLR